MTKDRLRGLARSGPERERNWAQATGFAAEAGKLALVPGENGGLGRVLVGLGDGSEPRRRCGRSPGCRDALPEGSYRLDPVPEGADPTRLALGWALATYAFTRYHARPAIGAALVWPEGADRGRVERLARAAFLARDLANTPAGDLGPEELARRRCRSPRRPAPAIGSSSATSCSPRIIRRSTRSAAPARGRRASSTSSGAIRRHPR